MRFPNKAGSHADTDDVLTAELEAAGITVHRMDVFRNRNGEVKTSVLGELHGWGFERSWHYWICDGPGIECAIAEKLHESHGKSVRVDGHCGCPSPRAWFGGLACGRYHVDDSEGLKALADVIKGIVEANAILATAAKGEEPDRVCECEDAYTAKGCAAVCPNITVTWKYCAWCGGKVKRVMAGKWEGEVQ